MSLLPTSTPTQISISSCVILNGHAVSNQRRLIGEEYRETYVLERALRFWSEFWRLKAGGRKALVMLVAKESNRKQEGFNQW